MRFLPNQRLRKGVDFKRRTTGGTKSEFGGFICRIQKPEGFAELEPVRRFGVIASKRVGNAVKRNRAKRTFREIFRLNQEQLPLQCDVVIIVRHKFADYGFFELQAQFLKACQQYQRKNPAS